MDICSVIDVRLHLFCREHAARAFNQTNRTSAVQGNSSAFVNVNVSEVAANHFISRTRMNVYGNLIRLCSAGAEQGGFHSEELCSIRFQLIHCWIFSKYIVAHLRFKHGLSHFL